MIRLALRRTRPAAMIAVAALTLAACGSGNSAAPVTVVQDTTVAAPVVVPDPVTVPDPTPTPSPTPSSTPTPESSSVGSSSVPVESSTSDLPPTSVSVPPPALVVRTADDPDTPGAVGGSACATDPAYFDEDPAGMAPAALDAWTAVVQTAAAEGVVLCLHDGKRSAAQQQAQYDEYAEQYGEEVADQLVLPWEKSAHVTGYAVDVHPATAFSWLQARAGVDGWCRIYDNEPWHFEFADEYRSGCPTRLPKPQG